MTDLLPLFQTFVRVVEAGSFTAVARERHTSQPTISRQIAGLEEHLDCRLFHRTTRALTLTDDGGVFYEHAKRVIEALHEAETSVGRGQGMPTGTLRLATAVVFGRLHIVPRLSRFLGRYPGIKIDLAMSDGFSDLIEEGIDLAIRVGELTDPGLIARRIGTTRRMVVATPEYLAKYGEPRTPADLSAHNCIIYDRLATGANWPFMGPSGPMSAPVDGRFSVNSTEGLRAAILQGIGIGIAPVWHFVDGEFETGKLVILLREFEPQPQPIHAVYPSRRFVSPKVRLFIDYLAGEFDLDPSLSQRDL